MMVLGALMFSLKEKNQLFSKFITELYRIAGNSILEKDHQVLDNDETHQKNKLDLTKMQIIQIFESMSQDTMLGKERMEAIFKHLKILSHDALAELLEKGQKTVMAFKF